MMEAQLILAMVTQRFRLRGLSDEPVEADASVTLRPRGPVPMQIEPLGAPHLG
jgi:cytochrome P450